MVQAPQPQEQPYWQKFYAWISRSIDLNDGTLTSQAVAQAQEGLASTASITSLQNDVALKADQVDLATTQSDLATTQSDLVTTQGSVATLDSEIDTERVRVDLVAPPSAGTVGQSLFQAPDGPKYADNMVSVDWYSDLNVAFAAAKARGLPAYGAGVYAVTEQVEITHTAQLSMATITTTDQDLTPVRIGSFGVGTAGYTVWAPNVINLGKVAKTGGWPGAGAGIELRNIERVRVWLQEIENFKTGVYATADSGLGNVNNSIWIGFIDNCQRGIVIQPEDASSWVNAMKWRDGLIYHASSERISDGMGGFDPAPGAIKMLLGDSVQQISDHKFDGINIEDVGVVERLVDTYSTHCLWELCRYEANAGNKEFRFNAGISVAQYNEVNRGLGLQGAIKTEVGNARYNNIDDGVVKVLNGNTPNTTPGTLQVANWTSQLDPAIAVIQAANGVLARTATAYGWAVSTQRSYFKSVADAVAKFAIQHTTGLHEWSNGVLPADVTLGRATVDKLAMGAGDSFALPSGFVEVGEISDPAAPAANLLRLYAKDNGAGKTQLAVRFPTGAVQILSTEP